MSDIEIAETLDGFRIRLEDGSSSASFELGRKQAHDMALALLQMTSEARSPEERDQLSKEMRPMIVAKNPVFSWGASEAGMVTISFWLRNWRPIVLMFEDRAATELAAGLTEVVRTPQALRVQLKRH